MRRYQNFGRHEQVHSHAGRWKTRTGSQTTGSGHDSGFHKLYDESLLEHGSVAVHLMPKHFKWGLKSILSIPAIYTGWEVQISEERPSTRSGEHLLIRTLGASITPQINAIAMLQTPMQLMYSIPIVPHLGNRFPNIFNLLRALCRPPLRSQFRLKEPNHTQNPPDGVAWLRPYTQPVFCP